MRDRERLLHLNGSVMSAQQLAKVSLAVPRGRVISDFETPLLGLLPARTYLVDLIGRPETTLTELANNDIASVRRSALDDGAVLQRWNHERRLTPTSAARSGSRN